MIHRLTGRGSTSGARLGLKRPRCHSQEIHSLLSIIPRAPTGLSDTGSRFAGRRSSLYNQQRLDNIGATSYRAAATLFPKWNEREWHEVHFMSMASVQEKENWLHHLTSHHPEIVDVDAFLVVLRALAQAPDPEAPRRAERWLHQIMNSPSLEPTVDCFQAIIESWAASGKEHPFVVVNRAERWLSDLLVLHESQPNRIEFQPTIHCYNAFLDACTRGRSGKNKHNQSIIQKNAMKADVLLRQLHSEEHHLQSAALVKTTTDSFNYVIRGWTRCKRNPQVVERVMGLIRLMEADQRRDPLDSLIKPNTKTYTMAMDALINLGKQNAHQAIRNGIFSAEPKQNGLSEQLEAEAILKYMHALHEAGVEGIVPHTVPYNILITGWANLASCRHKHAVFKAESVLRSMLALKDSGMTEASPDRISYEKVISAWAQSDQPNAGRRASWWLKSMWNDAEMHSDSKLLPTVSSYNMTMQALAKSEGATAAEQLLLDLGDKYKEDTESSLRPNSESFAIVVKAWLNEASHVEDDEDSVACVTRAAEWLKSLQEVENEKDLTTAPDLFSSILKAAKLCAYDRPEILELGKEIFLAMRHSRHHVDSLSYSYLLEIGIEALGGPDSDDERTSFVEELFNSCCEDGLVDKRFVRTLVNSNVRPYGGWTRDESQLVAAQLFHTWPFPAWWTRNLRSPHFQAMKRDLTSRRARSD